ncbi:MAG: 30S ribosomal protein S12 methylthiotransferase RimO [Gammaproteobacteria bacterium]|nr:30S ribosomal protein S12 methylthiotransferase RimO [Gammaproteobacteria bacterium]
MSKEPTVGFVSLGCPKALVDSEQILTRLRAEGYGLSSDYIGADLVVVNTCGFIDAAKAESLETIGEALNENGKVIVTGCMGANASDITSEYPQVLAVSGPHAYEEVMQAVHEHLPPQHDPHLDLLPPQGIKLTPRHYAYLKISEGCNHHCSFCIIPSLRGGLVSRPIGEVMDEATRLVDAGVRELLVISQDTSAYGLDTKYRTDIWNGRPLKTRFTQLAEALGELDAWVRLHYVYPYPHVDEVIPLMAEGKVLPYLDIPFQHASPRILKDMKRPAASEKVLHRIMQWREICPDITLRSTFIVGFPGETDDDFEQLLDFLEEAQLDRVGCFQYSPVEGASANELPNPVDEDIKQERFDHFMRLSARISEQKLKQKIGKTMTVLVDGEDEETGRIMARSSADAPEIDGLVFIDTDLDLPAGEFVDVVIKDSDEYDLYANLLEQDPT